MCVYVHVSILGKTSTNLNYVMVPLIEHSTCNSIYIYNGMILPTMICAGYLEGGIDSCQVIIPNKINLADLFFIFLVGILSSIN